MTTYVFGQKKQRVSVVLYEEFTGDGSDVTFQLTSSPANATWLATHGAWAAGNIHTTYPAHITKTNKKPIYDSIIPLTRNRITVSSISAGGLVTLDYAPRNNADFYIWYWYQLSTDDILSAYHRVDFVANMEGEMIGTVSLYDTDSSNVLSIAWAEDSSNDRILNLAGLVGGDRTLTLNESLTIVDGQDIDLHASGGEKAQLAIDTQNAERTLDMSGNLTVESNSLVNQDLTTDASVNFGAVTIADGGSLSLQEDITFSGATTENQIKMPDNLLDALSIQEGSNKYVTFDTVNDEEDIFFYKSVDILHTAMHANDHTLEIDTDAANYGDVKAIDLDYITGEIDTGQDEGIILINIDETQATGGEVFGLEVLSTDGGADGIHGMKVGPVVKPIHQDSGTFLNPTTSTDNADDASLMRDGDIDYTTTIFEALNEYIVIGAAAAFQDLELIFSTPGNKSIKPTFHYSTGGTGFTAFTPVDGTDGCRHTGVISWDASDLASPAHAKNDTNTYDIKIIRTRASSTMTAPVLGYAKTAATTEYTWDEDGNLSIKGLTLAANLVLGANSITGTSVDISNAELQQLSLIGATTISAAQWGYLGGATANGGALIDAADYAAMMALLSGTATGAFSFNSQNLTSVGTIASEEITVTGNNAAINVDADNATSSQFRLRNAAGTAHWAMYETLGAGGEQGTFAIYDYGATADRLSIDTSGNVDIVAHDAATVGLKLGGTLVTVSAAELNEAGTFFASTDISAAEAETLTDTSDADALHTHDTKQSVDATLTAFASLLTAANKIPYATGTDTGSELDLATTVGDPGSDTTLVSEQGIREALDAAAVGAHAILDGSAHTDSVAQGVTRGSIIYGNATPAWDELVKGGADTFLGSDGTDVSYRTAAQVMASLSGEAGAAFSFNSQSLTGIDSIDMTGATQNLNLIIGRDTYVDAAENNADAHIFVTQAGAGDFSQLAGSLVIQPRIHASVYRDIIFAGGLAEANAIMTIYGEGSVNITTHNGATIGLQLGGILITASAAEINYSDGVTSNIQTQLDARCLESVLGTSIGASLLLDGAVLKASAILQKYHAIDPSANIQTMLGSADNAAILSNIGAAPLASPNFTGTPLAPDHGAAATDMLVNVCYGTGNPPADPSTTTIGSIYIKYVA